MQLISTDDRYGTVTEPSGRPVVVIITAWTGLHPRLGHRGHWTDHEQPPIVRGTMVRVDVQHLPKPTSRVKKTLWLWVAGPDLDIETCWRAYLRRFDIEHTYRFVKNTLGWTSPAVRTPEQADRWTWLIVAGYNQSASPATWSRTTDDESALQNLRRTQHQRDPAGIPGQPHAVELRPNGSEIARHGPQVQRVQPMTLPPVDGGAEAS